MTSDGGDSNRIIVRQDSYSFIFRQIYTLYYERRYYNMDKNKTIKVLSGPKPWHELTDEERKALKQKYVNMENAKNDNKKEG